MIPGEIDVEDGEIELNSGRETVTLEVANSGDRPVQVGSHYHFYETNPGLVFERERARGYRLDIPAGTAVRFEPGQTWWRDPERLVGDWITVLPASWNESLWWQASQVENLAGHTLEAGEVGRHALGCRAQLSLR